MNRLATKIHVRHHAYINDRDKGRVESYYSDIYETGKPHVVPSGNDMDKVIRIELSDEWLPHVEIEFENWGEIFLTDYIIKVEFWDYERYTKKLRDKRAARESEDTQSQ